MIVEGHSGAVNETQQVNGQFTAKKNIYRYTTGDVSNTGLFLLK